MRGELLVLEVWSQVYLLCLQVYLLCLHVYLLCLRVSYQEAMLLTQARLQEASGSALSVYRGTHGWVMDMNEARLCGRTGGCSQRDVAIRADHDEQPPNIMDERCHDGK